MGRPYSRHNCPQLSASLCSPAWLGTTTSFEGLVSVAVLNAMAKSNLGKQRVSLVHRSQTIIREIKEGTWDRSLEAGAEIATMEWGAASWAALWLMLSLLSQAAQGLPSDGTARSGLHPPSPTINSGPH